MRTRLKPLLKTVSLGIALVAALTLSQGVARADEVYIAGFTNGCFGAGCAPGASAAIPGMTYSNSTFSGTTANGFRGLGGNPNPGSNFNNLGSLTLSTSPQSYNSPLTLQITFTAPQGISGSNTAIFVSTVTGPSEAIIRAVCSLISIIPRKSSPSATRTASPTPNRNCPRPGLQPAATGRSFSASTI